VKLGLAIEHVAGSERELAKQLLAVGERHKTDHDVFHMTRTLSKKERGHLDELARHAGRYGAQLDRDGDGSGPGIVAAAREKSAELLGRRPEPGLLLLRDLRELHLQGAQAARDADLLATVSACHEETLKTLKWTTYRLKEAAPQALTS
jgi:hypothetical protein